MTVKWDAHGEARVHRLRWNSDGWLKAGGGKGRGYVGEKMGRDVCSPIDSRGRTRGLGKDFGGIDIYMLRLMLTPVRPYIESSSPRRLPGLESLARNRTAAAAAWLPCMSESAVNPMPKQRQTCLFALLAFFPDARRAEADQSLYARRIRQIALSSVPRATHLTVRCREVDTFPTPAAAPQH